MLGVTGCIVYPDSYALIWFPTWISLEQCGVEAQTYT